MAASVFIACNLWSYVNSQYGANPDFTVLVRQTPTKREADVVQGTLAVGNAHGVAGIQSGQ